MMRPRFLPLALAGLLVACWGARSSTDIPERVAEGGIDVVVRADTLAGWFHVIWGNGTHYLLVTEAEETFMLVLDEAVGDPLVFDRRYVTVIGRRLPGDRKMLAVDVIQLSAAQR